MSAPRTMSEERDARLAILSGEYSGGADIRAYTDTDGVTDFVLLARDVASLRAAYADLEQEYAQAVRALREAEWSDQRPDSLNDDRYGDCCPVCAEFRRNGHATLGRECPVGSVLSTPRAQAVKEVE